MDRAHRRELKHDKFVEQVGHTVEYAAEHKSQVAKWGGAAFALLLIAAGVYWYLQRAEASRQAELAQAMRTFEAQVGPPADFALTFPTQQEKDKAVEKAFSDVATRHASKREGAIARYFLGVVYADRANIAEAEKQFRLAAESSHDDYASQAKLALAQLYEAQNRTADAEKLLRSIIDAPTVLVSKEQAIIALARVKAKTSPAEARKLLEPLRTERGPVSRAALTMLSELPK